MCVVCEGTEEIERTIELNKNQNLFTSVRYEEEGQTALLVRIEIGSLGYTLPIQAKYCFNCGERIKGHEG